MAKSKEQKFIEAVLKKQKATSEKARRAYEESGNPEIVIDYIKRDSTAAAIHEPWIRNALQAFIQKDRTDILKAAFLPRRGERKEQRQRAMENLVFANRIDKRRGAGESLTGALLAELHRTGDGNLTGDALQRKLTALKNRYNRTKRIKPKITVTETADAITMTAFPARITLCDADAFGTWSINFPKK